jgi:hypothetical protein
VNEAIDVCGHGLALLSSEIRKARGDRRPVSFATNLSMAGSNNCIPILKNLFSLCFVQAAAISTELPLDKISTGLASDRSAGTMDT